MVCNKHVVNNSHALIKLQVFVIDCWFDPRLTY